MAGPRSIGRRFSPKIRRPLRCCCTSAQTPTYLTVAASAQFTTSPRIQCFETRFGVSNEDRRNNRPICVVGGVLVWPLPGSLPAQAWTIGGRFDAIGRPCDRISARASVFRTATARHNQVEELDRREPFLILPFRPREMFSAFACCYPAQEPGATKWCRPRDSRMHPLP